MKKLLALLCFAALAQAAEHGKTDVFAAPGVTLAWAVARGADEARTHIVIRVEHEGDAQVTATGRDPFTKADRAWSVTRPRAGRAEVRIPRAINRDASGSSAASRPNTTLGAT